METEIWKSIPGIDYYQVSNFARVRRMPSVIMMTRNGVTYPVRRKGHIMQVFYHHDYRTVNICENGRDKQTGIHQLVALAFLGLPPKEGMVVDHVDGDKENSKPENLEWVTNTENVLRAYKTGLLNNTGASNGNAKLSDADVINIRRSALPEKRLAQKYGVTKEQIRRIIRREQRKDIA